VTERGQLNYNQVLWDSYKVCQERGHDASHFTTMGELTKGRCKYCLTWFWTEQVEHEEGAPENPDD